jgi:hypothetical protein
MNQANFNKIGEIVRDFEENAGTRFLNVKEAFWNRGADGEEIVYEVHVVIEESKEITARVNTYCYPAADFGRERGLYLYDTVVNWNDETVTLRFRFEE